MMGLTFIPVILSKTFPCSDIICSLGEVLCGDLSLHGGPEWPLCEIVEVRPGFLGDSEMLGMPESWGTCQGELRIGCGTGPRERRSEEHLTSDTEMQSLEFARLDLVLLWSRIPSLCSFSSLSEW